MLLRWIAWIAAATCWYSGSEAGAADLAVMPVRIAGLSPGEGEALGVLVARAFSRDAHVAVASPEQTRPLLEDGGTAASVAGRLGATIYVELTATRVGQAVKLSGSLFDLEGALLYRAEIVAPTLDQSDLATAALARALLWRKPVALLASTPTMTIPSSRASAEASTENPSARRGTYGPKLGLVVPRVADTSFSPSFSVQFDARFGPPSYFFELGAGLVVPFDDRPTSSVSVSAGYLEMGASHYLWAGESALYFGAGLSPALWASEFDDRSDLSVTCLAYAQLGIGFNRSGRAKFYGEVRLSQTLLAVAHPIADESTYGATAGAPHRPLLVAFQGGVGW